MPLFPNGVVRRTPVASLVEDVLTESENRGFASAADPTTAALRRKVRRFMGDLGDSKIFRIQMIAITLGENWWN
jgi:hypothetical protein